MTLRLIAALAGLTALSGCATTPVNFPAKIAAPDSWRAQPHVLRKPMSKNQDDEWWQQLADPELNRLVALALAENSDIRIASVRVLRARALRAGTVAEQRPSLSSNLEVRRERVPETRIRDADGVSARIPPYHRNQVSYQVIEASYEIDLFGRLALAAQASGAELLATEAEHRAVRQRVAYEVVVAYADILLAQTLSPQAQHALEFVTALLAAEQSKQAAGLSTLMSVRTVEDELATAHEALINIERSRNLNRARLALILGQVSSEFAPPATGIYFASIPNSGAIEVDLPTAVLDQRPDVDAAWHKVIASTTEAAQVRLEKYPKFTLTGNIGLSGILRRWLTGDALGWLLGATVQGPLFDGGRGQARTDAASAIAIERQVEYRKVVLQALHEVEAALTEATHAQQKLSIAESTVQRRVADAANTSNLLHQGAADRLALLRAELARIDAIQLATTRRHDLFLAWASVQKALGR